MHGIQELNAQEITNIAGGDWVDDIEYALNAAEATMYKLTHPN